MNRTKNLGLILVLLTTLLSCGKMGTPNTTLTAADPAKTNIASLKLQPGTPTFVRKMDPHEIPAGKTTR